MIRSVVGVEIAVGVRLERPLLLRPEWMRHCDFGLEGPALRTQVENLVGGVQACGCSDGEAHTEGGSRPVVLELRHAERRTSLQQHGQLVAGVAPASSGLVDVGAGNRPAEAGKWNTCLHPH